MDGLDISIISLMVAIVVVLFMHVRHTYYLHVRHTYYFDVKQQERNEGNDVSLNVNHVKRLLIEKALNIKPIAKAIRQKPKLFGLAERLILNKFKGIIKKNGK